MTSNASDTPFNTVTQEQAEAIRALDHFRDSVYLHLDIPKTLDFYWRRYVRQIDRFRPCDASTTVADIGGGYGWLAMAFAMTTPARVIAVDMDGPRLETGRRIADILGLADRIDWREGRLGALPMADGEVDAAYCIEVLEHVYGDEGAIRDLGRVSRDLVVLTTPNKWFPVIAHDTRLPFCHWLPVPLRQVYARAFNRTRCENDNLFWSPVSLRKNLGGYEVVSGFMHFKQYQDYQDTFPCYLPYVGGGTINRISRVKAAYYQAASLLGRKSDYVMPTLAAVYRRQS